MASTSFPRARGHFNIPCLCNPYDLRAYPDRISQVLEGVRADYIVKFLIFKREWIFRAYVSLYPGFLFEQLYCSAQRRKGLQPRKRSVVVPATLVGLPVHHVIRAVKLIGPATDIENYIRRLEGLQYEISILLEHVVRFWDSDYCVRAASSIPSSLNS